MINETVKIKWTKRNRDYYENKGYKYTFDNDDVFIQTNDLSPGSGIKVNGNCDYCGDPICVPWNMYRERHDRYPKDACKKCAPLKNKEMHWVDHVNEVFVRIQQLCKENNLDLITSEDEYIDQHMKITLRCRKHGIFQVILCDFLHGHMCQQCSYDTLREQRAYSPQYIKEYIESINNNVLENPEEYINVFIPNLRIRCNCGDVYYTSFRGYKKDGQIRCPNCSKSISNGEKAIMDCLDGLMIEYIPEYTKHECIDKRRLPFDFYLPLYHLFIEYDGIQHFNPTFGKESFDITQRHDQLKNDYCKENSLELLRIPYWEYDNIEMIIKQKLDEIGKRNSLIS